MMVRWPLPSGMMVVVGWITVPAADRSTGCCGSGFLVAALAGRAQAQIAKDATSVTALLANLTHNSSFRRI